MNILALPVGLQVLARIRDVPSEMPVSRLRLDGRRLADSRKQHPDLTCLECGLTGESRFGRAWKLPRVEIDSRFRIYRAEIKIMEPWHGHRVRLGGTGCRP